jgi:endonuclease YncB( thermonuclease family)
VAARGLVLPLLWLCGSVSAAQWAIEGYVVAVIDGDTLTILDKQRREHRVRLDGIDAPENGQPFGTAAKRHLYDLSYGFDVVAVCHKVDLGRNICQVMVGGVDVGLRQLSDGLAWFLVRYADELPEDRRAPYLSAEAQAKKNKTGLWSAEATPIAPWEWRGYGRRLPGD